MNNRFKFRVYHLVTGKYVDDSEVEILLQNNGILLFGNWHNDIRFAQSEYGIEQCIGLKDKNGNLIYEGDKVEISVYGDVINEGFVETDTQYQGIIVWVKQGFYVKVVDEFFYIPEEPEDVKIIGNIHEQPEQKDVK